MTPSTAADGSATVSRTPFASARRKPFTASGFSAANFGETMMALP